MNWYKNNYSIEVYSEMFSFVDKSLTKKAYTTKQHETEYNDFDEGDGYNCKVQLTESKNKIVLTVNFMNNVHAFPLYSEIWKYPKKESKRAIKTFNRCVNVLEDLKTDFEDEAMPGPTLQGMAREALRYVDIDRKKEAPSRSLEAAKYLDGETDWRSSLYGNRMPSQQPVINISNSGDGNVYFNSPTER